MSTEQPCINFMLTFRPCIGVAIFHLWTGKIVKYIKTNSFPTTWRLLIMYILVKTFSLPNSPYTMSTAQPCINFMLTFRADQKY
jgi:hypothetical protein